MIFIVVKYQVQPGRADEFLEATREFTEATRREEGNLFFEWSRSVEDENELVLVEAFRDGTGEAHVSSPHFQAGLDAMRPFLVATPHIVSRQVDGEGWDEMGELRIA